MKILILQSRMGIGDMVIYLPFIEAIAKKFDTKVSLIVKENSKAEEILKNNKYIDKIIFLKRSNKKERHDGFIGSINLAKDLRKFNFNKIFIFNSSLRYNLIAKLSGIKEIYQYPLLKKKNQHVIKAAQDFIKEKLNLEIESNPKINLNETEIRTIRHKYNFDNSTLNILLGTGGSGPNKRISASIYKSIIDMCKKKYKCRFFIATGKNEEEQKILNEIISEESNNFTRLDDLSISEIIPIIKNCTLSICNDTSFSHLSAALELETIILFADTATLYGSYNSKMHPIKPDHNEYKNKKLLPREKINPKVVFEKFEEVLSKLNLLK